MENTKPLASQVALVTGGTRGIGQAIARRLGQMGAHLAICARNAPKLKETERAFRAEGIEALALPADVTRTDQVAALIEEIRTQLGPIDVLVNNAGIGAFGAFHELSEADWDRVLNTNLRAVFLVSKAVAPSMIERRTGHIINISSLAGQNTFAGAAAYCASKWGLQGLTGCMAEDLRGYGIRVSVICPGTVHTEFSPHAGKDPGKMLQPDDVAHIVAMLVTQAPQSFASEIHLRPTHK
ncbi:MAG: SDR family oxidoreductase, partial [Candidatus Acidiferrales bacterium]